MNIRFTPNDFDLDNISQDRNIDDRTASIICFCLTSVENNKDELIL